MRHNQNKGINMKTLITALALSFSLSSFAALITCQGQNTDTIMILNTGNNGKSFPVYTLSHANEELNSTVKGFRVAVDGEVETSTLMLKLNTTAKSELGKKNTELTLTIVKQNQKIDDCFYHFQLNEATQAKLTKTVKGEEVLVDTLICQ